MEIRRRHKPQFFRLQCEALEPRTLLTTLMFNEISVNPPGTDAPFEYIEIKGTPGGVISNGTMLAVIEGDNAGDIGEVERLFNLGGRVIGSNGLLVVKSQTGGHVIPPETAIVTSSLFNGMTNSGTLENECLSFLLISGGDEVIVGLDLDFNDDGNPEGLPLGATILDGVGWVNDFTGDVAYGAVIVQASHPNPPDAATRFRHDRAATSVASWFSGNLTGSSNASLTYDTIGASANFISGAVLTPGSHNYEATPSNTAPTSPDQSFATPKDVELVRVESNGLLLDMSGFDADGDVLGITAVDTSAFPPGHLLEWKPDGSMRYVPPLGFEGFVQFSYRTTDGVALSTTPGVVRIQVGNPNSPPTEIELSGQEVAENVTEGTVVGEFSTIDADAAETFYYELVENAAGRFVLSGNQLVVASGASFDYELASSHSITIRATDSASQSIERTFAIAVTNINEAPLLTLGGGSVQYQENATPIALHNSATLSDVDSENFAGGNLRVSTSVNDPGTRLMIRSFGDLTTTLATPNSGSIQFQSTTIGTFSGGVGANAFVVNFNSAATQSAVQALVRALRYRNASENPIAATQTLTYVLTESDGITSNPATKSIEVIPSNDSPTLSGIGDASYINNTAPVKIAPLGIVADPEANFAGGKLEVKISSGGHASNRLLMQQGGGYTVSGNQVLLNGVTVATLEGADANPAVGMGRTSLTFTFTESATLTIVRQILRRVAFRTNTGQGVSTQSRTIQITLFDSASASTSISSNVSVS